MSNRNPLLFTPRNVEETEPLRLAAMWKPGIELLIANQFDSEKSLLPGEVDIEKARAEFDGLVKLLKEQGVVLIDLKAAYTENTSYSRLDLRSVNKRLEQKLTRVYQMRCCRLNDSLVKQVRKIIQEDINAYGRDRALRLNNEILSGMSGIPPGNIHFARDPAFVFYDRIIGANFRYYVRRQEKEIFARALNKIGFRYEGSAIPFTLIDNSGALDIRVETEENLLEKIKEDQELLKLQRFFEGGDAVIADGILYLNIGERTQKMGIISYLNDKLRDDRFGRWDSQIRYTNITAKDISKDNIEWMDTMYVMHGDDNWMPLVMTKDKKLVLGCIPILERTKTSAGIEEEISLKEFFDKKNYEIAEVPLDEHKKLGANVLNLGYGRIVASPSCEESVENMRKKGLKVLTDAPVDNIIASGHGGYHCLVLPLFRGYSYYKDLIKQITTQKRRYLF